jgi:hypothetical protein
VALLWHGRPKPNDVFYATHLPFDPGSPLHGVLRGGALEPGALAVSGNSQAKAAAYSAANSHARMAQRNLSLSGGASSLSCRVSRRASPFGSLRLPPTTTKATLSGRPRYGADASKTLACMPPSEGFPVVRPALDAIRPEVGRTCDGEGRFGEKHLNVGSQCHVCPGCTGLYHKPNTGCTQGSSHNSNERSLKCAQRISLQAEHGDHPHRHGLTAERRPLRH